jgi:hypothetical protein
MAKRHYMIDENESSNSCHEYVPTTTIHTSEDIVDNNEEEKEEQVEHTERVKPPTDTSLSNDMEVSTKTSSFIIVLLRHFMNPKL